MSLVVFFQVSWNQSTLSWNREEFENIRSLNIDSKRLWRPRIFVFVGDQDSLKLEISETFTVQDDGLTYSENFQQLSFRCDIAFEHYPFDSQNCSFGLYEMNENYTIAATHFDFSLDDVYRISGEWSLLARSYSMVESKNLLTFPKFSFTVRRHSTYYVITIIFPMVLTSVLIPLVFLIPAYTGEKISYLIAIFTSTAVFLNFIR
ncbi:unnamed protein product [Lymnaea stagnalis]|uniref:Neurotransmitter-gated ion-channel ligand-binding domain-containing protein n=1 Tax=Lymnaea stagnalis TaxID=6523 RepID=A0AAV2IB21_LYMST